MNLIKTLAAAAVALTLATVSFAATDADTLILETKNGKVTIELLPEVAPKHVERVKQLANDGFYDGLKFHRVIEGFMAQTGDPSGDGTGGSELPDLRAEFSKQPFERGTLGMARSQNPNSANSQFFITFGDASHLNGQYTVFGRVTDGMEFVDQIKMGSSSQNGAVSDPDTIIKMRTADQF
uniref:peptidylprolyl isomerase n=1 Tax=Pararhizobium sp. IMCC3301 TaxID=3067904 RepID=UPI002741000D|nr:peptidylprolyl isomerase [Pararhizobium sp. IMCC3301]